MSPALADWFFTTCTTWEAPFKDDSGLIKAVYSNVYGIKKIPWYLLLSYSCEINSVYDKDLKKKKVFNRK